MDPRKAHTEAHAAADAVRQAMRAHGLDPDTLARGAALMLGSGLQDEFPKRLGDNALRLPYGEIPYMAPLTGAAAPAHQMQLLIGPLDDDPNLLVAAFCGRYHLYQDLSPEVCSFYVRLVKALDIQILGITCAAGILADDDLNVGDIVMIEDTFNFSGTSALRGDTDQMWGEPFAPMRTVLPRSIIQQARKLATEELSWPALPSGVYLQDRAFLRGYQTPFESRLFRSWGADLVGKSTVIELEVVDDVHIPHNFAIALATNYANGLRPAQQPEVTSDHVIAQGQKNALRFSQLLALLLQRLHAQQEP